MQVLGTGDAIVSTYREHGHAIARGIGMGPLMAELYGKRTGCSGGRGGSMHVFDAATRFYGGNAIVGGGLPLAVGLALAEKMRGGRGLAACFFGEGAAAEGEFHESMNLAALWKLPVLFLCENNLYAMGTALARSESQTDIQAKAAAYGVRAAAVDGMDVFAVEAAVRDAAEHSHGPATGRRCSSSAPTGSARTRCSTRSCTATRRRSRSGAGAGRSSRSRRGSRPPGS